MYDTFALSSNPVQEMRNLVEFMTKAAGISAFPRSLEKRWWENGGCLASYFPTSTRNLAKTLEQSGLPVERVEFQRSEPAFTWLRANLNPQKPIALLVNGNPDRWIAVVNELDGGFATFDPQSNIAAFVRLPNDKVTEPYLRRIWPRNLLLGRSCLAFKPR